MLSYYHFGKWLSMMMMMMAMTSMLLLSLYCGRGYAVSFDKVNIEHDVLRFSYELESWLDLTKKPCEDFFGYVCSRSVNATVQTQQEKLAQQEQLKFNRFLENTNNEQLTDAELKLKHFYDSCRNARSIDQLMATLLYRSVGGWPAIDDTPAMLRKRNNITWLQVLSTFHESGISYFFNTQIELSSNKRVVYLIPDTSIRFNLPKFEKLAGEIMHSHHVDSGRARLVALEILNFERNSKDIRNINITDQDKVKEYSYADFKMQTFGSVHSLDWDAYFRKVMGKPLKPTDVVIVTEMPKLIQYFELLQATNLTRFLNWLWIDYLMDKTPADCKKLTKLYFTSVYQHVVERSAIDKVQMTQMYSEIGHLYDQTLASTPWIDEITQQNSKQFLERIMHLTLNGDAKLDAVYQPLTITNRNFYRNLEKAQRFKARQLKVENGSGSRPKASSAIQLTQSSKDYMAIFLTINQLIPQQQNLSIPLNYIMVGEYFAEAMIGGVYETPGAWRSMDSDRQFDQFDKCIQRQQPQQKRNYNLNKLILKILSQHLSWQTYQLWLQRDEEFIQKLDVLLKAGRLQMSMQKLYFIASTLVDCQLNRQEQRRQFIQTLLKQSNEFQQIFKCQPRDTLYSANKCLIIKEN